MASGYEQIVTAYPQPGTTNEPRSRDDTPAFKKVDYKVTDSNAEAFFTLSVFLETTFLKLENNIGILGDKRPGTLLSILAEINYNISRIADEKVKFLDSLNTLINSIDLTTVSINQSTSHLNDKTASQIQFDNFFKSYNGEKPQLPTLNKIFEESLNESLNLTRSANIQGFINEKINSVVKSVGTIITQTTAYRSLETYLKNVKDAILSPLLSSVESFQSNLKAGRK